MPRYAFPADGWMEAVNFAASGWSIVCSEIQMQPLHGLPSAAEHPLSGCL